MPPETPFIAALLSKDILIGLYILVVFLIGAALMFTRKMPALLVLPLMALAIVCGAGLIGGGISFRDDILKGVLGEGSVRLHAAIIVAFFGGMLSFVMQKTGVAENLVKNAAELIGDNPLMVSLLVMGITALLFTSIGGLGAVIMVAIVFLPMLATVGVPPVVAGGILLIAISIGGVMNAGGWVLYTETLHVPVSRVKGYALTVFVLMMLTGVVFICVELWRARVVRSVMSIGITLGGAIFLGAVLLLGLSRSSQGEGTKAFSWHVFEADFREHIKLPVPSGEVEKVEPQEGAVRYLLSPSGVEAGGTVQLLSTVPSQSADYKAFLPQDPERYESISFRIRSTAPAKLNAEAGAAGAMHSVKDVSLSPFVEQTVTVSLSADKVFAPEHFDSFSVSVTPDAGADNAMPIIVTLGEPTLKPKMFVPLWRTVLQYIFGVLLLLIAIQVILDLRAKLRRWQQQTVSIKWYAYLIPVVPLVMILVYEVDIMAAFVIGFVYSILVTLRPGSMSLSIQSMLQGSQAVLPAAMLMIGIGIILTAILGPSGWSAAHGGIQWPVSAALKPIFESVVPTTALGFIAFFGLLAPLALYRGPFNTWGLGFGVASIFITVGLPEAAVMAMLMTVGQIQGVCDPTNTHNVWLANELRVDVQALLWRTLPYIWGMALVGLGIAAFRFF